MTTARIRFAEQLAEQRWDDHRLYHHSRINQSLHLFSACCFVACYGLLFVDKAMAVWLGLLSAWVSRQIGHFFFEPKGYDAANEMTHGEKEDIKIGYNLSRKIGLLSAFVLSPVLLWASPDLFGFVDPYSDRGSYLGHLNSMWLAVGIGALLFRTVQLFFVRDVGTGIVWFTKILTDPFNDIRTYWKSPYYLLRGELIDPEIGTPDLARQRIAR